MKPMLKNVPFASPAFKLRGGWRGRNAFVFAVWLAMLFSLSASAEQKPAPAWPPPPAAPRVVYVREISGPQDLGVRPPVLLRLANWITGVSNSRRIN